MKMVPSFIDVVDQLLFMPLEVHDFLTMLGGYMEPVSSLILMRHKLRVSVVSSEHMAIYHAA